MFYYPDDSRYDGEFRKNKRDGEGTYYYSNGAWMNVPSSVHARHLAHTRPLQFLIACAGNRYEGQWVDNLRSGQGVLFYADGGKYEGYFKVRRSVLWGSNLCIYETAIGVRFRY